MALTFPANPVNGQIYNQYTYDSVSSSWRLYGTNLDIVNALATKANVAGGNAFTGTQVIDTVSTNSLQAASGNTINIPSTQRISQTGGIINVYTARLSSNVIWTGGWGDLGVSITLTPVSANSKFFLMLTSSRASTRTNNLDFVGSFRVLRNGSDDVAINGSAAGSRPRIAIAVNGISYNADHNPGGVSASALDSPATAAELTYKVQVSAQSSTYPLVINGSYTDTDAGNPWNARGQTSLTIFEVAK